MIFLLCSPAMDKLWLMEIQQTGKHHYRVLPQNISSFILYFSYHLFINPPLTSSTSWRMHFLSTSTDRETWLYTLMEWIYCSIGQIVFCKVSSCFFKCFFKTLVQEVEKEHRLHLFDFSPVWIFKWLLKLAAWEDEKSHWLHFFDFSPLCIFKCFLK